MGFDLVMLAKSGRGEGVPRVCGSVRRRLRGKGLRGFLCDQNGVWRQGRAIEDREKQIPHYVRDDTQGKEV